MNKMASVDQGTWLLTISQPLTVMWQCISYQETECDFKNPFLNLCKRTYNLGHKTNLHKTYLVFINKMIIK